MWTVNTSSLEQLHGALASLCASVPTPDTTAAAAALARLDRLTKPQGSLGQLEPLLVRLAGATGQVCPTLSTRAILLAAADHGVATEGVSAYPQVVTGQMVLNYLAGGAAINALAAAAGAKLVVVDAGVAAALPTALGAPGLSLRRLDIRRGSGNIAREPAMSEFETLQALLAGSELVEELWQQGLGLLALGEMGIANTTPAAALTSAFTGAPPAQTVGRGTGINDTTLARKCAVVEMALSRASVPLTGPPTSDLPATPSPDPLTLLAELGGLEIAVLAGATLAAAALRVPVLLDGYSTTAAALVAVGLAPAAQGYLLASHCSDEPGHALALAHLGLSDEAGAGPLLRLGLRHGEGSGAALAMPLLVGAARLMHEMATFEQAGVSGKDEG